MSRLPHQLLPAAEERPPSGRINTIRNWSNVSRRFERARLLCLPIYLSMAARSSARENAWDPGSNTPGTRVPLNRRADSCVTRAFLTHRAQSRAELRATTPPSVAQPRSTPPRGTASTRRSASLSNSSRAVRHRRQVYNARRALTFHWHQSVWDIATAELGRNGGCPNPLVADCFTGVVLLVLARQLGVVGVTVAPSLIHVSQHRPVGVAHRDIVSAAGAADRTTRV